MTVDTMRVEVAAAAIIASAGSLTDSQVDQLNDAERVALAECLVKHGRADLVSWDADRIYSEREARAIAVDQGIKPARFLAALALGEIEGADRDVRGQYTVKEAGLQEWIATEIYTPPADQGHVELPTLVMQDVPHVEGSTLQQRFEMLADEAEAAFAEYQASRSAARRKAAAFAGTAWYWIMGLLLIFAVVYLIKAAQ